MGSSYVDKAWERYLPRRPRKVISGLASADSLILVLIHCLLSSREDWVDFGEVICQCSQSGAWLVGARAPYPTNLLQKNTGDAFPVSFSQLELILLITCEPHLLPRRDHSRRSPLLSKILSTCLHLVLVGKGTRRANPLPPPETSLSSCPPMDVVFSILLPLRPTLSYAIKSCRHLCPLRPPSDQKLCNQLRWKDNSKT